MIRIRSILIGAALIFTGHALHAQQTLTGKTIPVVAVYYFHPTERCPIDQSIEETTRKLVQTDFAKEIKKGTLKFQVFNTDDKANSGIVKQFEMNTQALYLVKKVKGKELKTDLTDFAFSNAQSNPAKFKSGLKQEILSGLKP